MTKIDGKTIAKQVRGDLIDQIAGLKAKNVQPQLAIVFIGHDQSSQTYVGQKQKIGKLLGIQTPVYTLLPHENPKKLKILIGKLNDDPAIHGIIIQRPVPMNIGSDELNSYVVPAKDVDGFHPKTSFTAPVARAVKKILQWVYTDQEKTSDLDRFIFWLNKKKILIIGRGVTAGKPIADFLAKENIPFAQAHSQTENIKEVCQTADIIVSAVGKKHIVRHDMINNKTILIGVGLHGEDDTLQPDYNQDEIMNKVAYYTPVPGGVGPVNVAYLFDNLVIACKNLII